MSKVITIDGPSGSGKSTVSKALAKKLHFLYLDTGAMYRAVALAAERNGIPLNQVTRLGKLARSMDLQLRLEGDTSCVFLDGEDISLAIRTPGMDMLSSRVSAVKEVREAMTDLQRRMAKGTDIVAEGRDMGSVVFPRAQHKFFLTASPEVRARRRYLERISRGERVTLQEVERLLKKRDQQDRSRSLAPLIKTEDAVLVDSTRLTTDEVIRLILSHLAL